MHCHAGCEQRDIIAALKARGLWTEDGRTQRSIIAATYNYTDEAGQLLYQVVREEPKDSSGAPTGTEVGSTRKGNGRFCIGFAKSWRRRSSLWSKAKKMWKHLETSALRQRQRPAARRRHGCRNLLMRSAVSEVILIPDRGPAGYARVKRITRELLGKVTRLVYLELEDGKDATEWFSRGHSELELIAQLDGDEVSR